jgi:hypothetical protein
MGHYDWAYENQSVEQIQEALDRTKCSLERYDSKKKDLERDLQFVSGQTVTLINSELDKVRYDVKYWTDAVSKWEELRSRVESGEELSWEYCHNSAEPRRY